MINDNLDKEDAEFVRQAQECLMRKIGTNIGDVVVFPDGHTERIMYQVFGETKYDGRVQLDGGDVNGSYHLMFGGFASYSGAGGNVYDTKQLKRTADIEIVRFWIAHHDNLCGGCARDCECAVNVWELIK